MKPNAQLEMTGLVNCSGDVSSPSARSQTAATTASPAAQSMAARIFAKLGMAPGTAPATEDAGEWISTSEAARMLGVKNIRTVQRYCDEGRLKPVQDWRKIPGLNGDDRGGNYRIRKAAVIALASAAG